MKISFSGFAAARRCRRQFRWNQLGEIDAAQANARKKNQFIGHILQKMVERFYLESWWRNPKTVQEQFLLAAHQAANEFTAKEAIEWLPGELENWRQIAVDTIPNILSIIRFEKLLTPGIRTEYPVSLEVGSHIVYGRADFIYPSINGELMVLDGKGGKTVGKYTEPDQLLMYGLSLLRDPLFQKFPARFGFWWFRHSKIQWKKFKQTHQDAFLADVVDTLSLLSARDYAPTPGGHCKLCDFKHKCEEGKKYIYDKAAVSTLYVPDEGGMISL